MNFNFYYIYCKMFLASLNFLKKIRIIGPLYAIVLLGYYHFN